MTAPEMDRPTQPEPFEWYDDAEGTLTRLYEQLGAALQHPGARLELRPGRPEHGHGPTRLHVVPATAARTAAQATFEPLNKSHLCPPDCP